MRNYSRFIPGEEINAVSQWNFAAVDTATLLLTAQVKAREEEITRAEHEAIRQAGHTAGYSEGFAEGQAHAMLEAQRQINEFIENQGKEAGLRLASLIEVANQQLQEAEQLAAQGVLDIAAAMAKQVLRHEISVNPNVLLPVLREALSALFSDSKSASLRLNPLDLEVLQDTLKTEFSSISLSLIADSEVAKGGCLLESAGTVVDGGVSSRWNKALASLGLTHPWEMHDDEQ
jgi:flagellar assembly protein FliH